MCLYYRPTETDFCTFGHNRKRAQTQILATAITVTGRNSYMSCGNRNWSVTLWLVLAHFVTVTKTGPLKSSMHRGSWHNYVQPRVIEWGMTPELAELTVGSVVM